MATLLSQVVGVTIENNEMKTAFVRDPFEQMIKECSFTASDYFVVAVLGQQSSGKSTILNRLFSTRFDVMDATTGLNQTTKGVLAAKAKQDKLLVMDFEGSDGQQRGSEQHLERKLALFALAIADVVLLNMFEHNIGLWNGGSWPLLILVLQENLRLFQAGKNKMLLLFTIRDYGGRTPKNIHEQRLIEFMTDKIWPDISKPEQFQSSKLHDFFDTRFVFLPHALDKPEEFNSACQELSTLFESDNPNNCFKAEYRKNVYAADLPHYANSVWETIDSNRALDIPGEKSLVASWRCSQDAKEQEEIVRKLVQTWTEELNDGSYAKDLGKNTTDVVADALKQYNEATALYEADIRKEVQENFEQKLVDMLRPLYERQFSLGKDKTVENFQTALSDIIGDQARVNKFSTETSALQEQSLQAFANIKKRSCPDIEDAKVLREGIALIASPMEIQLKREIEKELKTCRETELKKLLERMEKELTSGLIKGLKDIIDNSPSNLWEGLREKLSQGLDSQQHKMVAALEGFSASEEECESFPAKLRTEVNTAIHKKFEDLIQTLDERLKTSFDRKFNLTKNGNPRPWGQTDIDDVYNKAFKATAELFNLFFLWRLKESDLYKDCNITINLDGSKPQLEYPELPENCDVFIDKERALDLFRDFSADCKVMYCVAQNNKANSSLNLPMWVYGVFIVLGFNELYWLLTNPLYLLIFIVFVVVVFGKYLETQFQNYLETGNPAIVTPLKFGLQVAQPHISTAKNMVLQQINNLHEQKKGAAGKEPEKPKEQKKDD